MSALEQLQNAMPDAMLAIGSACTFQPASGGSSSIVALYEEAPEALQPDGRKPQNNKALKLVTIDRNDADSLAKGDKFVFTALTLQVERVEHKDALSITAVCSEVTP